MAFILSRRHLLAAGPAAFVLPQCVLLAAARAQEAAARRPPAYSFPVGAFRVAAISDGYLQFPDLRDVLVNISAEAVEQALAEGFVGRGSPFTAGVTAHLVRTDERAILIDAGTGDHFGPTLGHLRSGLADLRVAPEEVDTILVTHMHGDHVGGLISGGAAAFPNATVRVSEPELAFWTDEAMAAQAPDAARAGFELAAVLVAAYGDRLEPFAPDAELLPGVTSVFLPGHTAGQCGFRLVSGDDELLVFGDAANIVPVQFRHPEAGLAFDLDPAQAAESRMRLFDMVAADRIRVAGTHMPFPGVGYVDRSGEGYVWVSEQWRYE